MGDRNRSTTRKQKQKEEGKNSIVGCDSSNKMRHFASSTIMGAEDKRHMRVSLHILYFHRPPKTINCHSIVFLFILMSMKRLHFLHRMCNQ
jgi:hypothetical protein